MEVFCRIVRSSIGRKILVAAAGLLLCGFLVSHLGGNLFMYVGGEAFNHYAETLEHNPLIEPAEFGLFVLFLIHILTTVWLKIENWKARPVGYEAKRSKGGSTWGSSTMIYSGLLLFVFLVAHIKFFKFSPHPEGLFAVVVGWLAEPGFAIFTVAAMAALGLHLSHGFQSAFQTFGLEHPRYTPVIKLVGWGFAALIALGFASFPIWAWLFSGGAS